MRSDMSRVVTEKPRRGSVARSKKHGRRLTRDEVIAEHDAIVVGSADDGAPMQVAAQRAKMARHSQYGWDAKEFSDLLGPLRKYLRKQVGRPWDKIYSEMNQSLDKRTVSGLHIWDHVLLEVETHTYLGADGKTVYPCPKFQWVDARKETPIAGLYVHPRTGLLCYKPGYYEQARAASRARKAAQPVTEIKVNDTHRLEQIAGIWYACEYGKAQRYVPEVRLHRGTQHERVLREAHFEEYDVLRTKRQLSRADLREHGLRNEARA